MKTLLQKKQIQKQRRLETKKNAVLRHNAFVKDHPDAYREERMTMLGQLVDLVNNTRYPTYQAKLILV
jgi:hypothetical protein